MTPVYLCEIINWLPDVTVYYRDPRTGDPWQLLTIISTTPTRTGTDYRVLAWCADPTRFVVAHLSGRCTVHIAPPEDTKGITA
jgi:hypothetical protein